MALHAGQAGEVVGWMEVAPQGDQLQITGRAWSGTARSIDYSLQIQRTGRSGKTTSKQGGRADLVAGEVAGLSVTTVNIAPQDQLAVLLTISSGGQVLATSGIHVGGGPGR